MKKNAFSLIELSIVLIIIGTLIVAIISSRKLVENTKLQAVLTEVKNFHANIITFHTIYNKYPGDFDKATSHWPSASPAALDGNGNGDIEWWVESFSLFRHLYLAEIVPIAYTGSNATLVIGESFPGTKFSSSACYHPPLVASVISIYQMTKHIYILGDVVSGYCNNALFTPKQLYYIETKIDDGKPLSGKNVRIRGIHGVYESCCLAASGCTGNKYDLARTTPGCNAIFSIPDF